MKPAAQFAAQFAARFAARFAAAARATAANVDLPAPIRADPAFDRFRPP